MKHPLIKSLCFATAVLGMGFGFVSCSDDEPGNDKLPSLSGVVSSDKDLPEIAGTTAEVIYGQANFDTLAVVTNRSVYVRVEGDRFVSNGYTDFTNLGHVDALQNIVGIPEDAWQSDVKVEKGNGYALRYSQYEGAPVLYGRMVVEDIQTRMDTTLAVVKYQIPFYTPIEPVKEDLAEVEFAAVGDGVTQTIDLKTPAMSSAVTKPSWVTSVTLTANKQIVLVAEPNTGSAKREGDVIVKGGSAYSFKFHVIQNPQEGLFAGGEGTENNPYQIATAGQLANVGKVKNAYFVQTEDIDLTSYINQTNPKNGWVPVDMSSKYDGQGHTIKGLWIDTDYDYAGLFGNCEGTSGVKNLRVEITEKGIVGPRYAAGVIAYSAANFSTKAMECVSVAGNGAICGGYIVSGLGNYSLSARFPQTIKQCRVNADVRAHGVGSTACGLVNNANTENCYVVGNVSVDCHITHGVNANGEKEACSYAVYPFNNCTTRNKLTATNCYILGAIPTHVDAIKIITVKDQKIEAWKHFATSCYGWGNVSDAQLKQQSTFKDWDFNSIWKMGEYPELRWL